MNNLNKRPNIHSLINREIKLLQEYNKTKNEGILYQLEAVRQEQIKLLDKRTKS